MDYRNISKDLLRRKNELINAKKTLEDEICMLENEKYAVRSKAVSDPTVAKGGGSKYEEHLVNLIVLIDNSYFRKKIVERELKMISNGMQALDIYETDLLECFYIHEIMDAAEKISNKYYKERSTVYRDKNTALEKFTRAVYGVIYM